jgi:hypothetical protein
VTDTVAPSPSVVTARSVPEKRLTPLKSFEAESVTNVPRFWNSWS